MEGAIEGPEVLVLAGPNGAGKTTASRLVVPGEVEFINADVIAADLAASGHGAQGLDVAADRIVLGLIRERVRTRQSFAVETNLAGRGFVGFIDDWRQAGFAVRLLFMALGSPELALRRVAARVDAGGHNVPDEVVRRRWAVGLRSLFGVYLELVDEWTVSDNSEDATIVVAEGGRRIPTVVYRPDRWAELRHLSGSGR